MSYLDKYQKELLELKKQTNRQKREKKQPIIAVKGKAHAVKGLGIRHT